jgi:hypothetical protein
VSGLFLLILEDFKLTETVLLESENELEPGGTLARQQSGEAGQGDEQQRVYSYEFDPVRDSL